MKRSKHREYRELARVWSRRMWFFEVQAESVSPDYAGPYLQQAALAALLVSVYERVARFELDEFEAAKKAALVERRYLKAFRRLPLTCQEDAAKLYG